MSERTSGIETFHIGSIIEIKFIHSAVAREIMNHDGKKDFHTFVEYICNKFHAEEIERVLHEIPEEIQDVAMRVTLEVLRRILS